jgi:UDP:flavonoid glycosyltransferase YjiC (YdhE family)
VFNHLLQRQPDLEVWVKSPLPEAFIKERFNPKVKISPNLIDFGMVMASSIDVLAKESWQRYKQLHDAWNECVEKERRELIQIKPDLVVSNVSYFTLEAARRLNIPSIAMSSLNWADIFAHYCSKFPGAAKITRQMQDAYNSALAFIQFTPCPPMPWLTNKQTVSPVTRLGDNRRDEINDKLNLTPDRELILIGLGGIEMRLPIEQWPKRQNTCWIIPDDWKSEREDCISLSAFGMPFIDVLSSVDALITKPGYGTFSEAVCNKTPFLYVLRGDWPEEPFLEAWADTYAVTASVTRRALNEGEFYHQLDEIIQRHQSQVVIPPSAKGHEEATEIILSSL